jgi:hypothetical protein
MAELKLTAEDWDVCAHRGAVILRLSQAGSDLAAWLTPEQAALAGMRLIQASWIADNAVCTRPGSDSAISRIDEVLGEFSGTAPAMRTVA